MLFLCFFRYLYNRNNQKNINIIMKKITINGEEYAVKYTIRALFIWEQITGKPFHVATLLDNYIFFYAIILASNQDKQQALSWDDFINALDDDPNLFNEIAKAVEAQQKKDEIFSNKEEEGEKDEKKN